jgi:hypothetical protein
LLYDAVTDSRKTAFAVTKGNSLTWKTSTVMVADWAFNNRGPNGADLVLTNLGTDDTIFHSVELIKLADVHVGTVGRGSVSGRTDGVVHASLAGTFMERQRMELTVTPAANWRFAGWSGELTGTNTRPFLFPTRDSQVTATFTYIPGSGATSADDFNSGTLTGGTGWSGGWTTTGTVTPTTNTDVGGYTILLQSGGIMTRALATPLANATLSFHWDIDSLEAGESGVVEVSANGTTWQQVWSKDMADNGTDTQNQPDLLTNTTVNLAAYGTVSHLRFKAIMGAGDRFWIDNVSVTAQAATNSSPLFTSDPINRPPATNGAPYAATLAGEASDPGGNPLSFSKVSGSGPSWLNVSANGALSGTPASTNMGLNSWLIRITNGVGGSDEAILLIQVTNINLVTPSGPPVITSARISGGSFIFSGTNATATAGGTYFVLATNNVAIPLADWPRISTNTYGVGGAFSVTIPVNWATPGVFYRLEQ